MSVFKKSPVTVSVPLILIERHPEFAAILVKRDALRTRRADGERARAALALRVPAAQVYDLEVERLIDNPLMKIEGPEARQRRDQLGALDREQGLIRRALDAVDSQLVQTRGRLSGEVRQSHLPMVRQDVRRALAAALRLRLIEGQRTARLSRLTGHGYQIGGMPTVIFSQSWGAVGDVQSHWQTVLRELRDEAVLSPEEFVAITTGGIPDSLVDV